MAVKKNLNKGYTYEDLFDTQEALDSGILNEVAAGTVTSGQRGGGILGFGEAHEDDTVTKDFMANKDTLGSMTNQAAIDANRERKRRRVETINQGMTGNTSILGGVAF